MQPIRLLNRALKIEKAGNHFGFLPFDLLQQNQPEGLWTFRLVGIASVSWD